jgi:bifunctional DNA-binding transcriptional regulator/antitoxin component of YhaV-PrlF toxin-antitoxin module
MSKTRWTLDVQVDPETGDQILEFPDDLMESAGWKEGDVLEWIDNKDGSWTLRKKDENTETDRTTD